MRRSPALLIAAMLMTFVVVLAFQPRRADPAFRLPRRYKLADLIQQQQRSATELRRQVSALRAEVDVERAARTARTGGTEQQGEQLANASEGAGLSAM
ncbi:MAG: hypothetical protein ABIS21_04645, partial [Acidimicrobiales bacterium]